MAYGKFAQLKKKWGPDKCRNKERVPGYLQGTWLFGRDMQDTSAAKLCTLCVSGKESPAVSEAKVEERP